jgi:hypothetical protein
MSDDKGSMREVKTCMKRLRTLRTEFRELSLTLRGEIEGLPWLHDAVLEQAALVADQVEAEPGHDKDTAAEIGRRIRALKEEHNGQPLY